MVCESVFGLETSGLDLLHRHPFQVAWSMSDDTIESHYIIPEPGWDYWDNQVEVDTGVAMELRWFN